MKTFDHTWLRAAVAKSMAHEASKGAFTLDPEHIDNPRNMAYLESCRAYHEPSCTRIIFTRDTGYQTIYPHLDEEFQRCLHLSLSFDEKHGNGWRSIGHKHALAAEWVEAFFPNTRNVWTEPPMGPEGIKHDVWHYRVFYQPGWTAPVLMQGHAATIQQFNELQWLSWEDRAAVLDAIQPLT